MDVNHVYHNFPLKTFVYMFEIFVFHFYWKVGAGVASFIKATYLHIKANISLNPTTTLYYMHIHIFFFAYLPMNYNDKNKYF